MNILSGFLVPLLNHCFLVVTKKPLRMFVAEKMNETSGQDVLRSTLSVAVRENMQRSSREPTPPPTTKESTAASMTSAPITYNTTEETFSLQTTYTHAEGMHKDDHVHDQVIFWALIDGFLFFAIVSGNILTIAAILLNRGISRVVSNQFIMSLACSDLFVGLMLPYHMMFYINPVLGEYFGLCITRLVLVSLACTASVLNIIGIAVDRFLAIVYPLHYNKFMTKRLARCLIFIAWIFAISIATTPTFWNKWEENSQKPESRGKCEFGYVVVPLYVMVIYLPCFVLLFTIMCGFYVKIFAETRKHTKRMRQSINGKSQSSDSWKSLQVVLLVMGSFTISYMPFIIIVILNSIFQHKTKTTSVVYKISNSLAMANSAVNPLIYAWKNQGFKKAFWKILHCKSVDGGSSEILSELRIRRSTTNGANPNSVMPENFSK